MNSFAHWLSGFTDGEACFHLKVLKRKTSERPQLSCAFQIGLRADDLDVLKQIQTYFGCGAIRPFQTKSKKVLPNAKPSNYFVIDSLQDLFTKVIPHFDAYPLRSKKARDYVIWREAVLLKHEVGLRPRGWLWMGQCSERRMGSPEHPVSLSGRSRRWTEADEQRFIALKHALEEGRKYKEVDPNPPQS
jgi:hypothetical protein